MIFLIKDPKPNILQNKEDEWTSELMSYITNKLTIPETIKGRYNHKDIKTSLLKETNNKCAYCESKITHIDHGDIEHIIPKSIDPSKTFEWSNLTIGCKKCNQFKGNYYDQHLSLLNPYQDHPEEYIMFLGPLPVVKNGNIKGEVTIRRLKLDRPELIERRSEHLQKIMPLVREYEKASDDTFRKLILDDILEFTKPNNEYSFMTKQVLDTLAITG
ncbi:retron system putative HNH endonuclease [Brevibacillus laterosporus]|uniref:retron system putative HNH endonuclease n=1 Tax=Brevibacillus laterosporus TaxID=1465 RepID=UPI000EB02DFB|nr:retron system putative HNH endonuclease [Brevibacillus laterosporus]AYK08837.1 TIGR02646 family protein [Brevibacillus laterosporus]